MSYSLLTPHIHFLNIAQALGRVPTPIVVPIAIVGGETEGSSIFRRMLYVPDFRDTTSGGWIITQDRWDQRLMSFNTGAPQVRSGLKEVFQKAVLFII